MCWGVGGGSISLLYFCYRPVYWRERVQMVYCMLAIDLCTGTIQEREGSDGLLRVGYRPISIYLYTCTSQGERVQTVCCMLAVDLYTPTRG